MLPADDSTFHIKIDSYCDCNVAAAEPISDILLYNVALTI
jgi:hypothetical protein